MERQLLFTFMTEKDSQLEEEIRRRIAEDDGVNYERQDEAFRFLFDKE